MSTPVQFPNQSLYGIESNIASLMACRDEAAEEGDAEAVAAADALIAEWTSQEVLGRKVNSIVYAIREYRKRAEIAREEAARISAHAREWEEKAKRVEQSTLAAMLAHNVTRIESETNTLKVQKNGGVRAVEIQSPHEVPVEYTGFVVRLTYAQWWTIKLMAADPAIIRAMEDGSVSFNHSAIAKALGEKVPCPECHGRPGNVHYTDEESGCSDDLKTCPTCEGNGLVPRTIPGARLLERGHHLRYE